MSACVSPTLFNKVFATLKWVCWKIGNIIFKCNLFRIFWSRNTRIYLFLFLLFYKKKFQTHDPRNTYKIKFWTHEKYPRKQISDPRNTHEKRFRTHEGTAASWHETHDGTRPMELAHSIIFLRASIVYANKTHTN